MVYLSSVDASAGHGGETYFPTAVAASGALVDVEPDAMAESLRDEYRNGCRFLQRTAPLMAECDERLQSWRTATWGANVPAHAACREQRGVGVAAEAGTALVWDHEGQAAGSEVGAWHAPCIVSGPEEKWIITWFKSPAPQWSPFMLGL